MTQASWLFSFGYKQYCQRIRNLSPGHIEQYAMIKQIRFFFWNLAVVDLLLYGSHEILHHKFIQYKASDVFAIASMVVSYLAFALILYEFVLVAKYIIKFYFRIDTLILSEIQSGSGGRDTLRILTAFEMVP